jgi:hypothetical protein
MLTGSKISPIHNIPFLFGWIENLEEATMRGKEIAVKKQAKEREGVWLNGERGKKGG